ncbi:MAG: hypothetical protein DI586_06705 [Micavibrio aeruginosavorus]|uniref:DUF2336 domain-containing protein n=1 Tax=Micavibrio aeruginosavorus TaxID=349221 RepID=A0A2W5FM76_9BACT|nr:MAG: hypothetical protein DI586_06705 [Micavibrio aeruginosavorus]
MSFFGKLFNKEKNALKSRQLALSGKAEDRLKVAKSKNTQPELLYYLAQNDPDASVRQAVAKNKSTPVHASSVLAKDADEDVRLALASRLMKLLPNLSEDKQSQLYTYAIQALGTLAVDEVLKIRIALSSTLKDHAHAPPKVVGQLARDIEREVSEPVLRFCAALSDEDLLDILKTHPAAWAVQAIAGRHNVSEAVSQGVIEREDVPAGLILMDNKSANVSVATMTTIVEKSKLQPQWQKPIAIRRNLPANLALELIQFVDAKVRDLLLQRTDYDTKTMGEIAQVVRRRLDFMDEADTKKISPEERVRQMIKAKALNENSVSDALAVQDKDLALACLAALAKVPVAVAEKIMSLKTPKPVIALAWKAGLSMRAALKLQQELAYVPHNELIYPRGGTDYPLTQKEINWQLEFFGIKP